MNVRGRRRRSGARIPLAVATAVLALGATACGDAAGEQAADPGAAPPPATDAPEAGNVDSEPAAGGGLSAQCQALVVDLLQTIEPYVAGHDIESMQSDDDFDASGLAEAIATVEEEVQVTCPRMDDPEAYETMRDLAQQHAPGTVWYVDMMAAIEGTRSSG